VVPTVGTSEGLTQSGLAGRAFLISPSKSAAVRDGLLEAIKTAARDFDLDVEAWWEAANTDSIGFEIVRKILAARFIFADISDRNPNVYYEVAVAHCFGIPVMLLIEKDQKAAFDLAEQRSFKYDVMHEKLQDAEILRSSVRDVLRASESAYRPVTPVSVAVTSIGWDVVSAKLRNQYGEVREGADDRSGALRDTDTSDREWQRRAQGGYLRDLNPDEVELGLEVVTPDEGVGSVVGYKKSDLGTQVHIILENGSRLALIAGSGDNRVYVKKPRMPLG
jgi:hypothetical protein